jgi:hypothetical protein
MKNKFNLGKILIVAVLTVLIWVWADRAKTDEFIVTGAIIRVDTSADPRLWISINNRPIAAVEKIVLEGPSSKTDLAQRQQRDNKLIFEFFLNPQQLPELQEAGTHSLNLTEFFRKSAMIKQLGLSVKSCQPARLDVLVKKLVEKQLNVECIDENGTVRKVETIEPAKVTIPVPDDWTGNAKIKLTAVEINQAKSAAITKTAYIELPDGQTRSSPDSSGVKIKLPATEKSLPEYSIKKPTIGFVLSPNLIGKYNVELLNPQEVSVINIRATAEAKDAYEQQEYQIMVYISDSDIPTAGQSSVEKKRKVDYNFPRQFVRSDEIQLKGEPVEAKFKLVPITAGPAGGAAPTGG